MDKRLETLIAEGGVIMRPPFDVPDVGRIAIVQDPTGAPMALANAKGVPYAWVYGLGANAVLRAHGNLPVEGKQINGEDDYGMDQGLAIKSIFGTDVARDTLGVPRNYVKICVAIQPFGMNLPAVTS